MFLPEKKSLKWIAVLFVVAAINFAALAGSRSLAGVAADADTFYGFAAFSGFFACISTFGYFGYKLFSMVVMVADLIGMGYLFYVVLSSAGTGWSDLTSVAGFMAILGFGVIVATAVQFGSWVLALKKKRDAGIAEKKMK